MDSGSIDFIDWDNLGFDVVETRSMYYATCHKNKEWKEGNIIPYGTIELSPAAGVLNYGQGVFEGTKAFRTMKDRVILFRPELNATRIGSSTRRLCIPEIGKDFFLSAIEKTLIDNIDYFWQVTATDQSGATHTTSLQSFTVNSANDNPDVFSLLNPNNGSVVSNLPQLLVWSPTTDLDGDSMWSVGDTLIVDFNNNNEYDEYEADEFDDAGELDNSKLTLKFGLQYKIPEPNITIGLNMDYSKAVDNLPSAEQADPVFKAKLAIKFGF